MSTMSTLSKFRPRISTSVLPKLRLQFSTKTKKQKVFAHGIRQGEKIVETAVPGKSRMGNIVPAGVPSLLPEEDKDWVSPWGNHLPIMVPMESPPDDWVPPFIPEHKIEFGAALIPKPNGYPLAKRFKVEQSWSIVENSTLLIVMQNMGGMQFMKDVSLSLNKETNGRIMCSTGVQNKYFHFALRFSENKKWQALAPLFQNQCFLAYQNEPEYVLEDLKRIISSVNKLNVGTKPGEENVYVLGGKLGENLVTSEDFHQLQYFESLNHLKQSVISILMRPTNSLIDVLRTPTNNLIKTIDYRVKSAEEAIDNQSAEVPQ